MYFAGASARQLHWRHVRPPSGKALISRNPAAAGAVVLETGYTAAAAAAAVEAAARRASPRGPR